MPFIVCRFYRCVGRCSTLGTSWELWVGLEGVRKRRLELRLLVAWAIMLWHLQDDWWDGAGRVTNSGLIVVVRRIRG